MRKARSMDSKIAQQHADGEKAKQVRAEEHQRAKAAQRAAYDEERAKEQARDEQQQSSGLLHEMLDARAGAVEDAWARSLNKDLAFRIDQLRSASFQDFARTHHISGDFSSLGGVAEAIDKLVSQRISVRQHMSDQSRMQTLTQIRASVEKFSSGKTTSDEMAQQIETVLLMTQHRQMREVLRWQYEEVLLCLTFAARASQQVTEEEGDAPSAQVLPPPRDGLGRLVQRVLSSIQTLHLNELSERKRADSISSRLAITQHCQLEKDYVTDFLARDLQQFGSNLTAKLLAECELHLARERREFLEEVDACVEQKVLAYRHEVCADEQQTVLEQRKKLQERLVVLERQGLLRPETKQQYERLRREHRACNVRLELLGAALEGLEWEH